MMKSSLFALLFVFAPSSARADIVWVGAVSNDIFDEANWDLSGSTVTAVDPNVTINDDVQILGAASPVELPDLTGQGRFQLGDGYTMTIDASSFVVLNNDGVGGAPGTTVGPNVVLRNGASFTSFFIANRTSLDVGPGCAASLGGGATPINASSVNLTAGALLAFTDETPAAYISEHLSKTTVDGAAAVLDVNVQVSSDGGQGCIVTAIGQATAFCVGSVGTCPCGNDNDGSSGPAGCANGSSSGGGALSHVGSTSVSAGDFSLAGQGLPPGGVCVFFQGENAIGAGLGVPFGDGLRCVGGAAVRLEVIAVAASGSAATSVNVPARGGAVVGDTKRYQLWYQDLATTPCGAGFNLTNGLELTWGA